MDISNPPNSAALTNTPFLMAALHQLHPQLIMGTTIHQHIMLDHLLPPTTQHPLRITHRDT